MSARRTSQNPRGLVLVLDPDSGKAELLERATDDYPEGDSIRLWSSDDPDDELFDILATDTIGPDDVPDVLDYLVSCDIVTPAESDWLEVDEGGRGEEDDDEEDDDDDDNPRTLNPDEQEAAL